MCNVFVRPAAKSMASLSAILRFTVPRSLSDIAFVTRRRRCGQLRGRRPEKPEAYSLEYVEDFFGTENDADGRRSFAAVERPMSDRLLRRWLVIRNQIIHI